ncbi:MAG: hypothetical protein DRJ64_00825 [Thermoprotei archaeon]|nr:MAG: hypothetical protein DRJ64_00825 [Thermoprotei archaeon]
MSEYLSKVNIDEYYANITVLRELVRFLKSRWVAIHCERRLKDGRHILIRYRKGKPIKIDSISDIISLIKRLKGLRPRTFYGTVNIYRRILSREDVQDYLENVIACTPTWDIDSRLEWWRDTLKVGKLIVEELNRENVRECVWLKWSGNGLHVHLNEKAFSPEVIKRYGALNVSYSVVDYIIKRVLPSINKLFSLSGKEIKVENLIDPQRVFTAPLSLHRELPVSCVAFKPYEIDEFSFEWVNPLKFRHNMKWDECKIGEADSLALKAIRVIGGYPLMRKSSTVKRERVEQRLLRYVAGLNRERISLDDLRLIEEPWPLDTKRVSRGFGEAISFLEDLLSFYAQEKLDRKDAIRLLSAIIEVSIPTMMVEENKKKCLLELYRGVLKMISSMSPLEVKRWLLSHGPPRKRIEKLF